MYTWGIGMLSLRKIINHKSITMNKQKKKIAIALKKAKTSLENILVIMEEADDKRCFDLIQQNLAVIGLLKSANVLMLENHLDAHIEKIKNKSPLDKKKMRQLRDEVVKVLKTAQDK